MPMDMPFKDARGGESRTRYPSILHHRRDVFIRKVGRRAARDTMRATMKKSTKDAETGLRDPGDVVGVGEGEVDAADEEVEAVGAPGGDSGKADGHAHQAHYGQKSGG